MMSTYGHYSRCPAMVAFYKCEKKHFVILLRSCKEYKPHAYREALKALLHEKSAIGKLSRQVLGKKTWLARWHVFWSAIVFLPRYLFCKKWANETVNFIVGSPCFILACMDLCFNFRFLCTLCAYSFHDLNPKISLLSLISNSKMKITCGQKSVIYIRWVSNWQPVTKLKLFKTS